MTLKGTIDEASALSGALRHRLDSLRLDGAVEEVVLELIGLTDIHARQAQLFDDDSGLRRRQRQEIGEAIRQLKQRYGASPVYRLVKQWELALPLHAEQEADGDRHAQARVHVGEVTEVRHPR